MPGDCAGGGRKLTVDIMPCNDFKRRWSRPFHRPPLVPSRNQAPIELARGALGANRGEAAMVGPPSRLFLFGVGLACYLFTGCFGTAPSSNALGGFLQWRAVAWSEGVSLPTRVQASRLSLGKAWTQK